MSVDILVQNTRDGYSDEITARSLIACTATHRPGVAVFPEAYAEGSEQYLELVQEDFEAAGYDVVHGLYDDADDRTDRHGLLSIIDKRLVVPEKPGQLVRLAQRNAIRQWVFDPESGTEAQIIGMHLNDRSEALRMAEVRSLLDEVKRSDDPAIVMGDMNAMHRGSARGGKIALARCLGKLVDLGVLPCKEPDGMSEKLSPARIGSLGKRLSEMASGTVMSELEAAGFHDADTQRRPTMPAGKPFAQLDHIMIGENMVVDSFEVLPQNTSDHRGIKATVSL